MILPEHRRIHITPSSNSPSESEELQERSPKHFFVHMFTTEQKV